MAEERDQSVRALRTLPLAQSRATHTLGTEPLCRDVVLCAFMLLKTEKNWKSPKYLTKEEWFYKI